MRKGTVAILAVAIIGALGIYSNGHKNETRATVQSATTSAATEPAAHQTADAAERGSYKDGRYTGVTERTEFGDVQVAAVISGGQISDVEFLRMPSDEGHSREVTEFSKVPLKHSAISKQSAHIDFVSGATTTSQAYQLSLQAALDQAQM